MPTDLAHRDCIPCRGGVAPLRGKELDALVAQINGWHLSAEHHIDKVFVFKNFADALAFTNRIGNLAEEQGHHPDIHLSWGKVRIEIFTHKIDGLTESDFVLAAKIDRL